MPIYEYQCAKCGRIVESWQGFSDAPLKTCRHCSGRLHKLISQSTFHLKGTGWYVTDYANKSTSASSAPRGKSEKSGGKDKKSKTESASKKGEE